MTDINTQLRNQILRQAHYIRRFENNAIQQVVQPFMEAKAILHARMAQAELWSGFTREWRMQRLQNMVDEINVVLDAATSSSVANLIGQLNEFAAVQAGLAEGPLADVLGRVGIVLNRLLAEQIFALVEQPMLGELFGDRMLWHNAEAVRAIRGRLAQAVITGEDMATARRELIGLGRQMGGKLGRILVDRSAMIARTEIQRVSNSVSKAVYDANQDVLKGIQYTSTLDRRTCLVCGSDDGRIFLYDSNIADAPILPKHPFCRCCYSPCTRSWKELGINREEFPKETIDNMGGQIPSTVTYHDWLKAQELESPGFVEGIMGKSRYSLWKDGKIQFSEMVKDNRLLTVEKLKVKAKKKR
ncbi:MAG: phage minor head protein [Pseudomonadota bacterium]